MKTIPLAQIAGAPTRQATKDEGHVARSLLDNYEWAEGHRMRFGTVHVDFATQRRMLKSSARWYAHLMRAHRKAGGPP
jgi:beta-glucosidase